MNRSDPVWLKIEAYCKEKVESARVLLEVRGKSIDETEFLRGKIAALRQLLKDHEPHE